VCVVSGSDTPFAVFDGDEGKAIISLEFEPPDIVDALNARIGMVF
jgi:hypothetical protein